MARLNITSLWCLRFLSEGFWIRRDSSSRKKTILSCIVNHTHVDISTTLCFVSVWIVSKISLVIRWLFVSVALQKQFFDSENIFHLLGTDYCCRFFLFFCFEKINTLFSDFDLFPSDYRFIAVYLRNIWKPFSTENF